MVTIREELNSKNIIKCLLTGVLMMISGMIMQVIKGQLALEKEMPEFGFIISVAIVYTLMGFGYSIVFLMTKDYIPGRNPIQKGLTHGIFGSIVVLIPGVLGMTAFDHTGLFNLWTPYKLEQYFVCFVDVVNLLIGGVILAKFFKADIVINEPSKTPKRPIIITSLIGFILLPLLFLIFHFLGEFLLLFDYVVPSGAETWYYLALISPFALTGGLLPLYYYKVKESFSGNWKNQSISFFILIFLGYYIMNFSFILAFGYSLQTVIFYLIISIPALLPCILINGFIIEKMK
ncbi:hypothetical protein [Candidatus Lokiarchaeum ossiferum]|uniref:hypothetical protein n=1 Tax=Candidatus Lokiarchaeum ossiferum TaxID=2951803 RepID=UPI00352CA034